MGQYRRLNKTFACVGEVGGKKVGVEFMHAEDQLKLEDLFAPVPQLLCEGPEKANLETLNEDGRALYFVSVVISSSEKEGGARALALGSTSKCVEAFQKVLYFALLDYINADNGKAVIEKLYDTLSSLDLKYALHYPRGMPLLPHTQRKVYRDSGEYIWLANRYESGYYYNVKCSWNNIDHTIYLPICLDVDEFLHVDFMHSIVFAQTTALSI